MLHGIGMLSHNSFASYWKIVASLTCTSHSRHNYSIPAAENYSSHWQQVAFQSLIKVLPPTLPVGNAINVHLPLSSSKTRLVWKMLSLLFARASACLGHLDQSARSLFCRGLETYVSFQSCWVYKIIFSYFNFILKDSLVIAVLSNGPMIFGKRFFINWA